jgi:hypothetical protein
MMGIVHLQIARVAAVMARMKHSMAGSLRCWVIERRATCGSARPARATARSEGPIPLKPYLIGTPAGAL